MERLNVIPKPKFKDYGVSNFPLVVMLREKYGLCVESSYCILYEGVKINPYDPWLRQELEFVKDGDPFDVPYMATKMRGLDLPPIIIDIAAELIRVDEERVLAEGYDESVFLHGRYDKTKDRARAVERWGENWRPGDPVPDCVKNGVPFD